MAGLVVQHNINAIGANNRLNTNIIGVKKATEKLSSGFRINRAGDDAAGLAISEKMRAQTRGLTQATRNANDGISLIQTAEGGLNETHSILQRMRELSVQASNGTYQQEDRDAMQLEVDRLKSEVDRISKSTQYNNINLLDGSLGGTGNTTNDYGAKYGSREAFADTQVTVTSNVEGAKLTFTTLASGKGGENAVWKDDGLELEINLVDGRSYTDDQINDLIKNATNPKQAAGLAASPADVVYKSDAGTISATSAATNGPSTAGTVAGQRSVIEMDIITLVADGTNGGINSADAITFTANSYGKVGDNLNESLANKISILTDRAVGKEGVTIEQAFAVNSTSAEITLHLATGVSYSEQDIHDLLAKEGFDYQVEFTNAKNPDDSKGQNIYLNVNTAGSAVDGSLTDGDGVGKDFVGGGKGLVFQIGANGVKDQRVELKVKNMGASSLGINQISVNSENEANSGINSVDRAINTVSLQRADLGALQNRLEYTVNNLTTTNENLTAAESAIRDTDMATEMLSYTKNNILQQAAQAMLAQANQAPQSVLQLLG